MVAVCSIKGCEKKTYARTWCSMHYTRWRTHGDPEHEPQHPKFKTMAEKFAHNSRRIGECQIWTAGRTESGYGVVHLPGTRKMVYVHVWVWEQATGRKRPKGMQVDHTCFNRACHRIEHLRLVTNKENNEHQRTVHSNTGVRGVHYSAERKKYVAVIMHHKKTVNVGRYDTLEEAAEAVVAKRLELFTHNDLDRTQGQVPPR